MATITPTVTKDLPGHSYMLHWAMVTANVEGLPVELPGAADKCVHLVGANWGGATLKVQGSNDGTNWLSLTDPQGNELSKTADAIEQILENPRYIRVYLTTAGTAAVISAYIFCRSTMR